MKTLIRSDLDGMTCSATFDDAEAYRYDLCWRWGKGPLLVGWLLNPSTATHEVLDNTLKGMQKRARAWDYAGFRIINLFGFRATLPDDMKAQADPVGPENDQIIRQVLQEANQDGSLVLAGWGCDGLHLNRHAQALHLAKTTGARLNVLKINGDGTPKHPLYVAHDLMPVPWEFG